MKDQFRIALINPNYGMVWNLYVRLLYRDEVLCVYRIIKKKIVNKCIKIHTLSCLSNGYNNSNDSNENKYQNVVILQLFNALNTSLLC